MLEFFNSYKLVFLRALIYTLIPAATLFLSQTETWSEASWNETGWFLRSRLLVSCVVAGITALASFIDQTVHRARTELETKRKNGNGDTELFSKKKNGE